MITPLAEAPALGIATAVPATPLTVVFIVGPDVVPPVHSLDTVVVFHP